ncbi:MAG: ABC transporter permease, partial [Actinomycetota bacterium]
LYSLGFFIVMLAMGLVLSPWGWLALPASVLISVSFSAAALLLMTFIRTTDDFDKVMNLLVQPLFLFSATFFPLSIYPEALQAVVRFTPLYHGVELLRSLTTGAVGAETFVNVAYLGVLGWTCALWATRRLESHLTK